MPNEPGATAAPPVSRSGDGASPPPTVPWPPILFLATILSGLLLQRLVPLSWPGLNDPPARVIGAGFAITGLGLAAWSLLTMLKVRSAAADAPDTVVLVTTGPFVRFRNPMYLGYALILLGLADTTQAIWIAILTPVFALAVTWLSILPEERHLEDRFGRVYLEYKANTRRWI
jgi:protein-S-isoprenylcysteine O-methyltransferase Ste14